MRVLIAVPCMDQVPSLFAQSLACMTKVGDCQVAFQIGSLVYTSRNDLAGYAMKEGFDYVFWLDSDMVFKADVLEKMMQRMQDNDIKMLTGIYFRRHPPYSPVIFEKMDVGESGGWKFSDFAEYPKDELFEVAACGFGCVLMATEVLLDVQLKQGRLFHPFHGGGEDISFCWRVRQSGYKIMCDPTIPLGHVGNVVIDGTLYHNYLKLEDNPSK